MKRDARYERLKRSAERAKSRPMLLRVIALPFQVVANYFISRRAHGRRESLRRALTIGRTYLTRGR